MSAAKAAASKAVNVAKPAKSVAIGQNKITKLAAKKVDVDTGRLRFIVPCGPVYENRDTAGLSAFTRRMLNRDSFWSSRFRHAYDLATAGISGSLATCQLIGRQYIAISVDGQVDTLQNEEVLDKFIHLLFFPRFNQIALVNQKEELATDMHDLKRDNAEVILKDALYKTAFKGPLGNSEFSSVNTPVFNSDHLWDWWEQFVGFDTVSVVQSGVSVDQLESALSGNQWIQRSHPYQRGQPAAVDASGSYVGGTSEQLHHRQYDYDEQFFDVRNDFSAVGFKGPKGDAETNAAAVLLGAMNTQAAGTMCTQGGEVKLRPRTQTFLDQLSGGSLVGFVQRDSSNAEAGKLMAIIQAAAAGKLSDEQFNAGRNRAVLQAAQGERTGAGLCEQLTNEQLFGASVTSEKLSKVTKDQVKAAAATMLSAPPTVVNYGAGKSFIEGPLKA